MEIRVDDLRGSAIAALLQEHLDSMHALSPPESVHALDLAALRHPDITFWTAWEGNELLGCGALKRIGLSAAGPFPRRESPLGGQDVREATDVGATFAHAELKSMRTARAHLRKGVARAVLLHILAYARSRGFARVSLETGSAPAFAPARQLYAQEGFVECGPFEGYLPDPHSVFMTKLFSELT